MASKNTLIRLRDEGHKHFDPIWQNDARDNGISEWKARQAAYRWLAKKLKMPLVHCHFSRMSANQLRAAIALCKQHHKD